MGDLHEVLGIPKRFRINPKTKMISGPIYYNVKVNGKTRAHFHFVNIAYSFVKESGGWDNAQEMLVEEFTKTLRAKGQCD